MRRFPPRCDALFGARSTMRLALAAALLLALPAVAQPHLPAAASPTMAGAADGPPDATAVDRDPPKLRASFARALELLREGHADEAARVLDDVAARSTQPERQRAAAALATYARRMAMIAATDPRAASELSDGRTQFIVTSTLIGFYSGVVMIDLLDIGDVRPMVGTLIATTGVGFVGALYGSRGAGIREVDADAYTLGATWGGITMLTAAGALDVDSSEAVQLMTLTGLVGGAFAGMGLSRTTSPTRGQVAFTNTTLLLGGVSALLGSAILSDLDLQFRTNATLWLAGVQIGTGVGLMLAPELDWSVSRSRLMLLGGSLGALVGWGAAALVTGEPKSGDHSAQIWGGAALAGLWGGALLTTWLTDGMAPDAGFARSRAQMAIVPLLQPDSAGLAVVGRF
ncbi:MAG: hypothetical protein H6747_00520 [Deltaproteobacteria bacterium]|nr:hypothetical protein [Deltaproteobacteria bacterium]